MGSQIYMLMLIPVLLAWECFCLLSAQCVNFVCNEGNVVPSLLLSYLYLTFKHMLASLVVVVIVVVYAEIRGPLNSILVYY